MDLSNFKRLQTFSYTGKVVIVSFSNLFTCSFPFVWMVLQYNHFVCRKTEATDFYFGIMEERTYDSTKRKTYEQLWFVSVLLCIASVGAQVQHSDPDSEKQILFFTFVWSLLVVLGWMIYQEKSMLCDRISLLKSKIYMFQLKLLQLGFHQTRESCSSQSETFKQLSNVLPCREASIEPLGKHRWVEACCS